MSRIGIVSWFGGDNFGSNVQAVALCRVIKEYGYDAENVLVEFNPDRKRTIKNVLVLYFYKFLKLFSNSEFKFLLGSKRKKNVQRFIKDNSSYCVIDTYYRYDRLRLMYDKYVVGSDQVWNPYYINEALTLGFTDKIKFSYASSIGVGRIEETDKRKYRTISYLDKVSVREPSAKNILEGIMNRNDIQVVADPVMLLDKEAYVQFASIADIPNNIKRLDSFAFCYIVGDIGRYKDYLTSNLEMSSMVFVSADSQTKMGSGTVGFPSAGPYEWLWLILNANVVCTDSFHAVVLCMKLKKDFILMKRFSDGSTGSQNSRLSDMFSAVGMPLKYNEKVSVSVYKEQIDDYFNYMSNKSRLFLSEVLNLSDEC